MTTHRTRAPRIPAVPLVLLGLLASLLGACGTVAPLTDPEPDPDATGILWFADHADGDLSDWQRDDCGGVFGIAGGEASVSDTVAHSAGYAAALTIRDVAGDQGASLFRWCESRSHADLYYGAWLYFPEAYQAVEDWWNVVQFKSRAPDGRNDAFFVVNVGNDPDGGMRFYLFDWQQRQAYPQAIASLPVGRWVHLEVRYVSSGDSDGRVTVWQDGVELYDVMGEPTRYPGGTTDWSVNNFAPAILPDPATIYVDDATISTERIGAGAEASALGRASGALAERP